MSLELRHIQVRRGGRDLLRVSRLQLEAGVFTAFCGPNGAGKSTALSLLSASLEPDQGSVYLDQVSLQSWPVQKLAQRRAMVSQHNPLNFPFQVHEVVAMGRMPHQSDSRAQRDSQVIDQCMEWWDLTPLAGRNILTLSGGERQRVHLARALAQVWDTPSNTPAWLLLDEPTTGLDLKYQLRLFDVLQTLAKRGWGVVAVLHELHWVREHAQRVVLFEQGRIVGDGKPQSCLSPERIQSAYGLAQPYEVPAPLNTRG
nr:heme ABC transporter ATP-binding protein [Oceanococcus sp. HetDA_MAG_MS8]